MKKNAKKNVNPQPTPKPKKAKRWNVKKVLKKTGQIFLGVGLGAVTAEVVTMGACGVVADAELAHDYYRYKTHKDDYSVKVITQKKSLFKKEKSITYNCRRNPLTGKVEREIKTKK